jgi:hypothetical protein
MATGQKITLAEAHEGGARRLLVYCEGAPAAAEAGCHHAGQIDLAPMLGRYGPRVRLNELPFRCRCKRMAELNRPRRSKNMSIGQALARSIRCPKKSPSYGTGR